MRRLIPVAFLLLAACGGADEAALPTDDGTAVPAAVASATPSAGATEESPGGIPEALRGRWGLVAADCEPGRADAKGLLVVSADKLEFYESIGRLGEVTERLPQRVRASFAFTGEGMTWTRDMVLEVQGDRLVRQEFGTDAAPEPFDYLRCP